MKFDERAWNIKTQKEAVHGEGGVHRAQRLRPKGVPFIRLHEVYARVGKSIN